MLALYNDKNKCQLIWMTCLNTQLFDIMFGPSQLTGFLPEDYDLSFLYAGKT
jgi:hypothetical protein